MEFKLVELTKDLKQQFMDYIKEWHQNNQQPIPSATSLSDRSFEELLDNLDFEKSDGVYEKGLVPATLYCLVDNNNRIYGCIHVRHELNDFLTNFGGHVGYGVRPSERGKGIAVTMFDMLRPRLKELRINKALLTCDKTNIASAKTIVKCGGRLENEVPKEDGITQRYWIEI